MVPFESLWTASYYSIINITVSLAISETFSIKEWPDLEIWVWVVDGHENGTVCSIHHVRLSIGRPL